MQSKEDVIMKCYEIKIIIDETTPCLKDSVNNTFVDTRYEIIKPISQKVAMEMKRYGKWEFDWSDEDLSDCTIYALYVEGSQVTQGLIACREYKNRGNVKGYIEVALVEANPKNVGNNGKYKGVGAHLFSIASRLSFERGYEGYVTFISKTDLIEHYIERLHAEVLFDNKMQLNTKASEFLVGIYDKKARDMYEE